jgi:hypothetical protein
MWMMAPQDQQESPGLGFGALLGMLLRSIRRILFDAGPGPTYAPPRLFRFGARVLEQRGFGDT